MKRGSAMLLLALSTMACRQAKEKPPVSPEKMQLILADIHIAEVYSSMLDDSTHQSRHKNYDSLGVFYADIFAHHQVTKDQFEEGIRWYKNHPGDMDSVYYDVVNYIGTLEAATAK